MPSRDAHHQTRCRVPDHLAVYGAHEALDPARWPAQDEPALSHRPGRRTRPSQQQHGQLRRQLLLCEQSQQVSQRAEPGAETQSVLLHQAHDQEERDLPDRQESRPAQQEDPE